MFFINKRGLSDAIAPFINVTEGYYDSIFNAVAPVLQGRSLLHQKNSQCFPKNYDCWRRRIYYKEIA